MKNKDKNNRDITIVGRDFYKNLEFNLRYQSNLNISKISNNSEITAFTGYDESTQIEIVTEKIKTVNEKIENHQNFLGFLTLSISLIINLLFFKEPVINKYKTFIEDKTVLYSIKLYNEIQKQRSNIFNQPVEEIIEYDPNYRRNKNVKYTLYFIYWMIIPFSIAKLLTFASRSNLKNRVLTAKILFYLLTHERQDIVLSNLNVRSYKEILKEWKDYLDS